MKKEKASPPEPSVEWVVRNARGYNKDNPNEPRHCDISFPEMAATASSSSIKASEPVGVPVDANLAVHMIKNFQVHYNNLEELTESFLNEKRVSLTEIEAMDSIVVAKEALKISYGVSFSKEILLKILSQAGCEGVRLYFCARESDIPNPHVSLVAVGFDAENYDLNYKGVGAKMKAADEDIPDRSLIAEYGYPPDDDGGNTGGKSPDITTDDHYFLLKKANALKKLEPNKKGNKKAVFEIKKIM